MPKPIRSHPPLRWILIAALIGVTAAAGGWWLGHRQVAGRSEDPRRALLSREVARLRLRMDRNEASATEQQRLLELLVGLERKEEAIALLEPMADREPDRWALRLMLAELRRAAGDPGGAERELRLILNRQPNQVEALQLLTLLKLEQGRAGEAEAQVKAAFAASSRPEAKPEALGLGLLLGELQQKRGQGAAAETTYRQIAEAFPRDQRPLLALALLRHERGDIRGALETLEQARGRSADPNKPDPNLDRLAASWGLAPLRARAEAAPPRQAPAAGSGSRNP